MVRSLWTAASGMLAQQTNVDTIANNLANVSTTGYKTQQNQFKSLLYQNLQTKTTSNNGETKPTGAQVGLGVRSAAIQSIFTDGSFLETGNLTDFALSGDGFFAIKNEQGGLEYTRNGNFYWAMNTNGGVILTNSNGNPVQSSTGTNIELPATYQTSRITITQDGQLLYPNEKNVPTPIPGNIRIGIYQFRNPTGLDKEGESNYSATAASGPAINEATMPNNYKRSTMVQGYLEGSNVQVANEMVNLITAQRAYELNSRAITTTDNMMQQANNLRQ